MTAPLPDWYHPLTGRATGNSLEEEQEWARLPKTYGHRPGVWYFVGQLAEALGRSPETIRRWERLGWLPRSPYIESGVEELDGTERTEGRRRLYSEQMIDAVVRIAEELGLLGTRRCCPGSTNFAALVDEAWAELAVQTDASHTEGELPEAECIDAPWRPRPWSELSHQPASRQSWLLPPGH